MAQLEREAAGFDESSEPTSMTNSSTVEGEHTIQDVQNEDEDERTLNIEAAQAELNDKIEEASEVAKEMIQRSEAADPDVVETYSSNLRPNEDEIQLLRLKLEEVRILDSFMISRTYPTFLSAISTLELSILFSLLLGSM